jgi:hypothetical protein
MIYRGPDFLSIKGFGSSRMHPPLPFSKLLSFSVFLSVAGRDYGEQNHQIRRRQESLGFCKSFNTLWCTLLFSILFDEKYWIRWGEKGGGGGAKSDDGKKAWFSINTLMLSGVRYFSVRFLDPL